MIGSLVISFFQCKFYDRKEEKEEKDEGGLDSRMASAAYAASLVGTRPALDAHLDGLKAYEYIPGKRVSLLNREEIQDCIAKLEEFFQTHFIPCVLHNAHLALQTKLSSVLKTIHIALQNEIAMRRWNGETINGFAKIKKFHLMLYGVRTAIDVIIKYIMNNRIHAAHLHMRIAERNFPEASDAIFEIAKKQLVKCGFDSAWFEFAFTTPEDSWLETAIQNEPLELIKEALGPGSHLLKRYEQIHSAARSRRFENPHPGEMTQKEMVCLARQIEYMLQIKRPDNQYFIKAGHDSTSHNLFLNFTQREVYIISYHDESELQASGAFKIARSAIALSMDAYKVFEDAVELSPNFARWEKLKKPRHQLIHAIECEFPFYDRLQDVPGFAIPRFWTRLNDNKAITIIMKRATANIHDWLLKNSDESARMRLGVQVLHALAEMQKRGIYHGDLKTGNILIANHNQPLITDFGWSFFMEPGAVPKWPRHSNYYGAWWDTPPELMWRDPALPALDKEPRITTAQIKKIEAWVAGCILYRIVNSTTLSERMLQTKYPPLQLNEDEKKQVNSNFEESENFLPALERADPSSMSERMHYFLAVLNLKRDERFGPRWTLDQADEYMQKYFANTLIFPHFLYKMQLFLNNDPENRKKVGELIDFIIQGDKDNAHDVRRAHARLQQANKLFSDNALVQDQLGELFWSNQTIIAQDLHQAERHYRRALLLKPDLQNSLEGLGDTLRQMNKLDEAKIHLERALQLNERSDWAHGLLGELLIRIDEADNLLKAKRHLEQCIALALQDLCGNSISTLAHGALAVLHSKLRNSEKVREHIEMARKICPDHQYTKDRLQQLLNEIPQAIDASTIING